MIHDGMRRYIFLERNCRTEELQDDASDISLLLVCHDLGTKSGVEADGESWTEVLDGVKRAI